MKGPKGSKGSTNFTGPAFGGRHARRIIDLRPVSRWGMP